MSRHHENVTWQSADGTWSRGFNVAVSFPDDPDDEWGVEFGEDFQWVSCGHPDEDSAWAAWRGGNPGGGNVTNYSPETAQECMDLDCRAAELQDQTQGQNLWPTEGYHGPSKANDPVILAARTARAGAELAKTRCDQLDYRLQGYSNYVSDKIRQLTAAHADLARRARAAGAKKVDDGQAALASGLRRVRDQDDARAARRSQSSWGYRDRSASRDAARLELEELLEQTERALEARSRPRANPARKAGAGADRQPRGVPTGGQFASRIHPESDVTLEGH